MSVIEKIKRIRRKDINPHGLEYVHCPHCHVLYRTRPQTTDPEWNILNHLMVSHADRGWK